MSETSQQLRHRRWIGRVIRVGLVAFGIVLVVAWLHSKRARVPEVQLETQPVVAEALAPDDMRIYSRDSAVNLVLQGDRILAGLSPKKIAEIRAELTAPKSGDTSGFAGAIAAMVKEQVAEHIDTHAVYPLAEIRDIRYENGEIVIVDARGNTARLFGSVQVDKQPLSKSFDPEDARRFVEAARARKQALR